MLPGQGPFPRFKRDRYTGENRCLPCTVVNICLGFLFALAFQITATSLGAAGLALAGSIALFGLAIVVVYLRGYLVPGTPGLTKRYLPSGVLAAFGKDRTATGLTGIPPADRETESTDDGGTTTDVEAALLEAEVLTERADGGGFRLTGAFERDFEAATATLDSDDAARGQLLDVLGVPDGNVELEAYGGAFRVYWDGTPVGTWESRPAFLADVAAAELLAGRVDGWERRSVPQRSEVLGGLRSYLTTCPGCGGALSFGTETVESCCSTHEVVAVTCEDCDARVFETCETR